MVYYVLIALFAHFSFQLMLFRLLSCFCLYNLSFRFLTRKNCCSAHFELPILKCLIKDMYKILIFNKNKSAFIQMIAWKELILVSQ